MSDAQRDRSDGGPAFKRAYLLPGVVLTALELVLVVGPFFPLFLPTPAQQVILVRAAGPVIAGALLVWFAALASWLAPVQRAVGQHRRGAIDPSTAAAAYRALGVVPLRAMWLRTALWAAVAAALGLLLVRFSDWTPGRATTLLSVTAMHAAIVNVVRAAWYARLSGRVREALFPAVDPLQQFADRLPRRILLVTLLVGACAVGSLAAFIYYFLPIGREGYLDVQTYLPAAIAVFTLAWGAYLRSARRPIDEYLAWQRRPAAPRGPTSDPRALAAYRRAQSLPYRLVVAKALSWILAAVSAALVVRWRHRMEVDNAVLMVGAAIVIMIGAALYEAIWHRHTVQPLLVHLSMRHRLPGRELPAALSLRAKLLISFGGLVLFACGMSLFWAFIQYKSLATSYLQSQAQLKLDWVRSEVQGRAAQLRVPPTAAIVREVLDEAGGSSSAAATVYYYVPTARGERPVGLGVGPGGVPRLPWHAVARVRTSSRGTLEFGSLGLQGVHQRLKITWQGARFDLGSVVVLTPTYRGRGPGIQRPLKELLLFFLVLFGVSGGFVVLTVAEFTTPIRRLEQRADEMARGELARPVTSGGEGDEVGRLTFALEEMRRALREKIRSTEEVNLDLEREVQRRTADLARKNRELAEALEKLTRAQSQLVRAEKMASIGQLVAGIAHEINNPVNAIANTVGPLSDAIDEILRAPLPPAAAEAAADVQHMVRVIQNGARRTKDIVQALHNYSRTDDERVVEFDLNRGLDDSLELLRHHLKGSIRVERRYDDVGRVRAHAGQLNQVFMNLLTNAAQALAGRDGAVVAVATRRRGDQVVITIGDNGPGIPSEILPRIFDPFFTTKEVGQGSGLGLSIVHGIVERHGGTIEVESAIGEGTTFIVTLPAARNDTAPHPVRSADA